jgi:hypothetical protein
MAVRYICDRCDATYRSGEFLCEVVDMDLCGQCSTEFDHLLLHWVSAGKGAGRKERDTIDEQLIKILRAHLGLLPDEDDLITSLKQFMADQFLDLLLETKAAMTIISGICMAGMTAWIPSSRKSGNGEPSLHHIPPKRQTTRTTL